MVIIDQNTWVKNIMDLVWDLKFGWIVKNVKVGDGTILNKYNILSYLLNVIVTIRLISKYLYSVQKGFIILYRTYRFFLVTISLFRTWEWNGWL